MTRCVLLAVPLLCALPATARAGWVTLDYNVAGGGIGVAYGTRLADLGLTYGMPMSGRVSYDPAVPGVWAADPLTGEGGVLRYAPPGSFTLDIGGNTFASGGPLQVEWRDPSRFFQTGLFSIQAPIASPGPVNPGSFLRLDFTPWPAVTWASQGMVPDLGLFAGSTKEVSLVLEGTDPGDYYSREVYLDGFITDATVAPGVAATPEPGTLTLTALGAGLTLVWRRRPASVT